MDTRKKIYHSFRFKFIVYALISMALTVVTEGVMIGGIYFIFRSVDSSQKARLDTMREMDFKNTLFYPNYFEQESHLINEEFSNTLNIILIIMVILLALTLFTVYFLLLTKRMSAYLNEIAYGIQCFSAGDFDTRIEIERKDELGDIALNLNKMAEDIKKLIDNERKVESKKNDLITNVAHDLRTPLTSIIGYLDLVSNRDLPDELRENYIAIAYNKSKRLEYLIEDLFTYTKLDFGVVTLNMTEVDIIKMMEQMIEEFYPKFEDNDLAYSFSSSEKAIKLMADGALLGRAFANLFENAIKYGVDGKNIIVKVKKDGIFAVISITNFGEVIPEDALENLFAKFYRVDNSRNLTTGGTGLGLAIAKNIITMHKGDIRVKSDLDGTVFRVWLPVNL